MSKLRSRRVRATSATASLGPKLEKFRRLLVEAKEFAKIHDYFHDVLVADPLFTKARRRASNTRLVAILEQLLQRSTNDSTLHASVLRHVRKHQFWHGWAQLGAGQVLLVMYFDSIDLGLCCYSRSLTDPRTEFFRFSAVEVPAG